MPNHVHLLITLTERINPFPTAKCDIPNIVGKYKAAVTRAVGKAFMPSEKTTLWQSSFNDRIIRNEAEYLTTWEYIVNNPSKWMEDHLLFDENESRWACEQVQIVRTAQKEPPL